MKLSLLVLYKIISSFHGQDTDTLVYDLVKRSNTAIWYLEFMKHLHQYWLLKDQSLDIYELYSPILPNAFVSVVLKFSTEST